MIVRPSDWTACSQTSAIVLPLRSVHSRGPKRIELPSSRACASVQSRNADDETMREASKPAQKKSGGEVAIARSTSEVTAPCCAGSNEA